MKDHFVHGILSGLYPMNILFCLIITVIILRITVVKNTFLIIICILSTIVMLHCYLLLLLYLKKQYLDFTFYLEIVINTLLMIFLPYYLILKYRFKYHSILFLSALTILLGCKISFMVANNLTPEYNITNIEPILISTARILIFYAVGSTLTMLCFLCIIFKILKNKTQRIWFKKLEITLFILIAFYSLTSSVYFLMVLSSQNAHDSAKFNYEHSSLPRGWELLS